MSGHNDNGTVAVTLCNQLNDLLGAKIYDLERQSWNNWCSFQGKGKVFAWVRHGKSRGKIQVTFFGRCAEAKGYLGYLLPITELSPKRKALLRWRGFGGKVEIHDEDELKDIVEFLVKVSYPLSVLGDDHKPIARVEGKNFQ